MAQQPKELLSKLADRGEDVIGRITDLPGAQGLLDAMGSLPERLDEVAKRVRGLDALERRIEELERRLDDLGLAKPGGRAPAKRAARATKAPASKAKGAAAKAKGAAPTAKAAGTAKRAGAKRAAPKRSTGP